MSTKRVCVTGGPGFIGRRVVERFLKAGWAVTSFSLPGEVPAPEWTAPVDMRHGDVTKAADVSAALGDADLIIHLAALVGHAGDYDRQWSIIADGTRNVCDAARANTARLVVASSIAVYGTRIQTEICDEEIGHGPWAGAYGRAKQGQETIALERAEAYGLPLTLVRPANVYGLGGASAWGEKLIEGIRASGGATIGDAGNNDAGLVHVENLADALFLAGTEDAAIGRTYNVCDETGTSWERFMTDMAGLAGMPPPPNIPLDAVLGLVAANEDPANCVSPKDPNLPFMEGVNLVGYANRIPASRIRSELGWQPSLGYDAAMAEMKRQLAE